MSSQLGRIFRAVSTPQMRRWWLTKSHNHFQLRRKWLLREQFNTTANIVSKEPIHVRLLILNERYKLLNCRENHGITLARQFHLSKPRRATPILPLIGAFLARFSGPIAQVLKLMAVIIGRYISKYELHLR